MSISGEDVRNLLLKLINSPHRGIIADVIMGHVAEEEVFVRNLLSGLAGTEPSVRAQVGREVFVKKTFLPTWRLDEAKMSLAGMMHKDYVKGEVIAVNPYKKLAVLVSCPYISSSTGISDKDESSVPDDHVISAEEFPMDSSDDLPF